jgi:heme exporter protein A
LSDGLRVENLCRRFGRRWALARVRFDLPRNEGLLLLGANGSGKTTLLRCLATALKPHDGTLTFGGRPMWDERDALRERIQLLTHASALYEDLSGAENLSTWASLAGVPVDAPALLARVGLSDRSEAVRTYSAGMKRRLALARLMIRPCDLVLLDEPFTALDVAGRELMAGVIRELMHGGATVVLSTHHAHLGEPFCRFSLELDNGQVVAFRERG